MKKFAIFLSTLLLTALLAGCAGTPVVYYTECDCPGQTQSGTQEKPVVEGEVRTGLAIVGTAADSKDGEVSYDVTVAAVSVDADGGGGERGCRRRHPLLHPRQCGGQGGL